MIQKLGEIAWTKGAKVGFPAAMSLAPNRQTDALANLFTDLLFKHSTKMELLNTFPFKVLLFTGEF